MVAGGQWSGCLRLNRLQSGWLAQSGMPPGVRLLERLGEVGEDTEPVERCLSTGGSLIRSRMG
jgi:hypothetical protein